MCLMVCQNIKYCVLCLITCLAKLVDNSLHISGRPYCLPPAHLLTSSMRHNIHKGVTIVTIVTIVRIVRIVTIVKIVPCPMCEQKILLIAVQLKTTQALLVWTLKTKFVHLLALATDF